MAFRRSVAVVVVVVIFVNGGGGGFCVVVFGGCGFVGGCKALLCGRRRRPTGSAPCFLVFVPFLAHFLPLCAKDTLPLRGEWFFIPRRSLEDEKNLWKMMEYRTRVCFSIQVFRTDVQCAKLIFVYFRIAGVLYVRGPNAGPFPG